jgi:hypothetical protein
VTTLIAYGGQPLSEPAHPTATYLFTVLMGAFFAGLVVWSVLIARKERTWLPIACLAGGALSFAFEPVLDAVGHIFYPLGSPLTVVTIFDTTIPLYVWMAYVFWVGAGSYLMMRWLERGRSGADLMRMFLIWVLLEPLFEYPAVLSKALIYYGDQPFELFDYPLYWPPGNSGAVFVAAYALLLAKPYLRGARGFVVAALIPPLGFFAANAMGSWPVWLAINSEAPLSVIWLAGAVSIALYVALTRLVGWMLDRGVTLAGSDEPRPAVGELHDAPDVEGLRPAHV